MGNYTYKDFTLISIDYLSASWLELTVIQFNPLNMLIFLMIFIYMLYFEIEDWNHHSNFTIEISPSNNKESVSSYAIAVSMRLIQESLSIQPSSKEIHGWLWS